jgi:site-specific recombinase XerD
MNENRKDSGNETSVLGTAIERFAQRLQSQRYTKGTRVQYLAVAHKFDCYIGKNNLALNEVQENIVEQFLKESTNGRKLKEGGRFTRQFWRKVLSLLLEQLRDDSIIPPVKKEATVLGPRVSDYLEFLRRHRGMRERTIKRQRRHIGRFLDDIQASTDEDLRSITIEQIDGHLINASSHLARESIGSLSSSLRGFVSYLHMCGILSVDLREYVATPHIYPLETMPRAVAWSEIQRMLAGIDDSTLLGCRDCAMLTMIAYCGLRACDVAALRIQDIDWRNDMIHARRPKNDTREDIPLVPAVGEKLIAYLQQRPASPYDEIFLTVKAPVRPLINTVISWRARLHLSNAGVKGSKLGSHTLRHSFAVELQRKGRSLKEIGEALGHSHPRSTFIYAKANVEGLREVALDIDEVQI